MATDPRDSTIITTVDIVNSYQQEDGAYNIQMALAHCTVLQEKRVREVRIKTRAAVDLDCRRFRWKDDRAWLEGIEYTFPIDAAGTGRGVVTIEDGIATLDIAMGVC